VIPGKQYTPEVLLRVAWRRKWFILLPAVLIATTASVVTYRLPNRYRSETLILVVPQRVPETYVRSTVTTRIEDRLQSISQQILSRTRLEKIIQDFNLYADRRNEDILENIVEAMRKDIRVDIVKGDAFSVGFTASDPRTAMRVTERLSSLFIDESLHDRERLAEGTNEFLESQLQDARRQLILNEKKLEDYRRRHDGELPNQHEANLQGMHNTEMQLQTLSDSINRDRDRRLLVERSTVDASIPLPAPPTQFTTVPRGSGGAATSGGTGGGDDQAGTAAERLQAGEAALGALQLRLKPEHPDVVRMKRAVAELRKRAEAESAATQPLTSSGETIPPAETQRRSRLSEAKAELENVDRQIAAKLVEEKRLRGVMAEYQKRLEATPTRESELTELMRDYDTLQQSYRSLLTKKEDSQIAANLERRQIGEQFKILDPARLPERPFSPDRPRFYLMGLAAALGVGLGLAALMEYFDRSMRSEEDVRVALNLSVLATIPVIAGASVTNGSRRAIAISVTVGAAVVGAVALAWRLLR
jgi:polysaccharide chain length determinant protein (PEP-CTERM system associated)